MLKTLTLQNYRNTKNKTYTFKKGINLILGDNGLGKTTLLEAIHLLSTGRSFQTSQLKELINYKEESFFIEAVFESDGIEQTLKVYYDGTKKQIKLNQTTLPSFSSLLGVLPSILYAPKDISLIAGSPQERRRFFNIHLAQTDPLYVYHLLRYLKALKQRNRLLKEKRIDSIEQFEYEMNQSSTYLMGKRREATVFFQGNLNTYASRISNDADRFNLSYKPSSKDQLIREFEKMRPREIALGTSLVGPHRDDFSFALDEKIAKNFSSEGQKRTCLIALKFAEYSRMQEKKGVTPLMLIDDFGIHLDDTRLQALSCELNSFNQVFLTTPLEALSKKLPVSNLITL